MKKIQPTGYWTFSCNPALWDEMDQFMSSADEFDDYLVTDYQRSWFEAGQRGVIRVGMDRRRADRRAGKPRLRPGIYAVVEVLGNARPHGKRQRVDLRYLKKLRNKPVLLETLKGDPTVTDKWVLQGFRGSTMPLDADSFARIDAHAEAERDVSENLKRESADSLDQIKALERKYAHAAPQVKEAISKRIERGPMGAKIKRLAGFKCQLCEVLGHNPFSFRTPNGKPYVEAHHVVFVSKKEKGSLGLANLVALCANHHRQLHYGRSELLENAVDQLVFRIDGATATVKKLLATA